jgi:hypothetical protein
VPTFLARGSNFELVAEVRHVLVSMPCCYLFQAYNQESLEVQRAAVRWQPLSTDLSLSLRRISCHCKLSVFVCQPKTIYYNGTYVTGRAALPSKTSGQVGAS